MPGKRRLLSVGLAAPQHRILGARCGVWVRVWVNDLGSFKRDHVYKVAASQDCSAYEEFGGFPRANEEGGPV